MTGETKQSTVHDPTTSLDLLGIRDSVRDKESKEGSRGWNMGGHCVNEKRGDNARPRERRAG